MARQAWKYAWRATFNKKNMNYTSPYSYNFKELIRQRKRYAKALVSLCATLPGPNKGLYTLIIRDLIYHFDRTAAGYCRSSIKHDGRLWNADNYEVLTKRYNRKLKKPVSVKTVKRYHADMKKNGLLYTSRYIFRGKNTLHRSINIPVMEEVLLSVDRAIRLRNDKALQEHEYDELRSMVDEAKRKDICREKYGVVPFTYQTNGEIDQIVESTIEFGHLLFNLGRLTDTAKRPTQRARARIRRLVELRILGPQFLVCLRAAIDHGEFENEKSIITHRFWPNWLETFYPEEGEESIEDGLAASWFQFDGAEDSTWMTPSMRYNFRRCHGLFCGYLDSVRYAESTKKLVQEATESTGENEIV
ncbi:hypothetical protein [Ruficoccus sp. ZRK36]|uniref:hypothetical protein n=1 Tax=Ruficoccus sp. ZRK36 TaxID=2866311 RepID=UPI001C72F3BD|nr:hypothetical protein [Ruficoccus sp. ZRK36]QYY36708.1 hypothetical protein K0V07_04350 [Ruficoccus sp. ZRK36]QYY37417.1 hypothetical protein K0V07_08005 [Ruficoccus sp. ZRK36]